MKHHLFFRSHLVTLAASAALTAAATFTLAPVARAQSTGTFGLAPSEPTASPAEHDAAADIFEAVRKGADKLQKQAKEAGKIGPELKQIEERQAEYIKHQTEIEHRLEDVLVRQSAEIRRLTEAVERLESEIKTSHPAAIHAVPPALPVPPTPSTPPAAPLPATEPSAPKVP